MIYFPLRKFGEANVRFGSESAAPPRRRRGCFTPESRHRTVLLGCQGVESCRWNLFFVGCIISALNVEATMPLTGPIPEGRSFFCPHCGALYALTYLRHSKSDNNSAKCAVCGHVMAEWNSTNVPTFKLVHRPEDA
jgi:hypothetical protein